MTSPGPIEAHKRTIGVLQDLIADLAGLIVEDGVAESTPSRRALRRRVANALPLDKLPVWLEPFRDPGLVCSTCGGVGHVEVSAPLIGMPTTRLQQCQDCAP